jgi:hypothetical protein
MRMHIATIGSGSQQQRAHNLFIELAREDSVGRHVAEPDPEHADAILLVDPHFQIDDPFLRGLQLQPLYGRHRASTFIYHEGDNPVYTLPGVYVGASPRWSASLPVVGGPYPQSVTTVPAADVEPDLLFSFRGTRTHPVRDALLGLRHERAILEASEVGPWGGRPPSSELTFAQVRLIRLIHRSKFVLCPRGKGPSSHRLYETLAAGRVPVVISDDWLPPPGVPWDECSVRIAEADAAVTASILEQLEPRWSELAEAATQARQNFTRTHLWDHFAQSIAMVASQPRPTRLPVWAQTQRLRIRLGKARETLREKTAPNP